MRLQVIRFSELYKEFLVPFSFVENYFTPSLFDMFITVNMSEEESISPNRRDKRGTSSEHFLSPADAVALFSHQLDNALSKHKKELFEEIDDWFTTL